MLFTIGKPPVHVLLLTLTLAGQPSLSIRAHARAQFGPPDVQQMGAILSLFAKGDAEGLLASWSAVPGCPLIVVSQWKVDSRATSDLIIAFHRELRKPRARGGHTSAAEALRSAEMRLLKTEKYKHPFYWAGFAAVGDALPR